MGVFNIVTSIGEAATLRENTTSDAALLEDVVNVFKPHASRLGEEAIRDRNDDSRVQNRKDNVPL